MARAPRSSTTESTAAPAIATAAPTALVATGEYPLLNPLQHSPTEHDDFGFGPEAPFESGLYRILDGITVLVSKLHT
ncbi:hypothetical protein AB0M87_01305 [Streptomyces sp. NPDC051320]|uniref:hypothetical protein n=1 Tax=Streptomyces sp. NPDC051320 TaxID=3154644 RepID=UPI0034460D63